MMLSKEKEHYDFIAFGKKDAEKAIELIKAGKKVAIHDMPFVEINRDQFKKLDGVLKDYITKNYFLFEEINEFSQKTNRCLMVTKKTLKQVILEFDLVKNKKS